jgi:hypothetical protein
VTVNDGTHTFFFFPPLTSCVFPPLAVSRLVVMSPTTRPNNKDKHPGYVDRSPPRRAPAQKKANDEKSPEDKQAQEESRKAGIRHLAEVEECSNQKLKTLMALGPKPRPRIVTSASQTATSTSITGKHMSISINDNTRLTVNEDPFEKARSQRRRLWMHLAIIEMVANA